MGLRDQHVVIHTRDERIVFERPVPGVIHCAVVPRVEAEIEQGLMQPDGAIFIGCWTRNESGQLRPDRKGDYAAVVVEKHVIVISSRTCSRAALHVLKGLGADLERPGEHLAYDLPPELYGDEVEGFCR